MKHVSGRGSRHAPLDAKASQVEATKRGVSSCPLHDVPNSGLEARTGMIIPPEGGGAGRGSPDGLDPATFAPPIGLATQAALATYEVQGVRLSACSPSQLNNWNDVLAVAAHVVTALENVSDR